MEDKVLVNQAINNFNSYESDEYKMAELLEKAIKEQNEDLLSEAKSSDGKTGLLPETIKLLNKINV